MAAIRRSGTLSRETGFTPLLDAPRIADRLGIARCWIKNDSLSAPSLSFKDRVVTAAINACDAFELDTIGCASPGNLANAVAAHAARAGLKAWIFIPESLERAKILGTLIYGANVVRVRGHYDDVNRLCAQVADHFGWGIANVNLRSYYGEGSKSMAFEIAEQLGWRLPSAVIAPMAGGSLVTKLSKGLANSSKPGWLMGIAATLWCSGKRLLADHQCCAREQRPDFTGHSQHNCEIDRHRKSCRWSFASRAIRESGGWGAAVSDEEIISVPSACSPQKRECLRKQLEVQPWPARSSSRARVNSTRMTNWSSALPATDAQDARCL